jgi:hypothetical protein
MKKLEQIFGALVPTFFTESGGVSLSEIARRQAEAKQKNDTFTTLVAEATAGVFFKRVSFVGAAGSPAEQVGGSVLEPQQLSAYSDVASRNAQTALLMHGLKLWRSLQDRLKMVDLTSIVGQPPVAPDVKAMQVPVRKAGGTLCPSEKFMEMGNIDEMVQALNPAIFTAFDFTFWKEATELNARAAVLGKLLSEQGCFFRQLNSPLPKAEQQPTQTGVIITQWARSYNASQLEAFAQQRDRMQAEYDTLQSNLNGFKKQIKDAVRAYDLEVEKNYQAEYGAYRIEHARYSAELASQQAKYAQEVESIRSSAETFRQEALAELASLRIRV